MSPPAEKIFFFPGSKNWNLLGFLHCADSEMSSIGIVYCHPFAEEKNMSHSVVVKAARMVATAGIPIFRFDLSGCGDSEGDFNNFMIEDWLQDLDAAIDFFRQETGISQCILWGLRLGAGLVLLCQKRRKDIAALILWQPVLDFALHINQFLRRAISSKISKGNRENAELTVNDYLQSEGLAYVIGYPITKELCGSFANFGNQPAKFVPSIPVLILSISQMAQPAFDIKKYSECLKEAGSPMTFQHVIAEPFWDRYWQWESKTTAEVTLNWVKGLER